MTTASELFDIYAENLRCAKAAEMSLKDYLEPAGSDPSMYASAAERMIKAIGEPDVIDTQRDPGWGGSSSTERSKSILRSRTFTAWKKRSNGS